MCKTVMGLIKICEKTNVPKYIIVQLNPALRTPALIQMRTFYGQFALSLGKESPYKFFYLQPT